MSVRDVGSVSRTMACVLNFRDRDKTAVLFGAMDGREFDST